MKRYGVDLLIGQLPDFFRNTTQSGEITVVCNYEHAVLGKLDIRLEIIRTRSDGCPNGGECVFRCLGRNATMGMNRDAANFGKLLKCKPRATASEK